MRRLFRAWFASVSLASGLSWSIPLLAAALAAGGHAQAQPLVERAIEFSGETLHYAIRTFPPDAHVAGPVANLEPNSALNTAKLIGRHLLAGASEEAALLSNAPRRRFDVLREYQASVGDDGFKKVFAEYFESGNRVVAELVLGDHSLLVWRMKEGNRYAGQYFVRIEGRVLMDDVPSPARARLRRLMEAVRAGEIALTEDR